MTEPSPGPDRLEHPPVAPFPRVFWATFLLAFLYLMVVFASTGSHILSGGHSG